MTNSDSVQPSPGAMNTWYGPFGARPGVERPDEEIITDVMRNLQEDPSLGLSTISVSIGSGIVTLSGVVSSEDQKASAEQDVWDAPGVVEVRNDLQLAEEQAQTRSL